MKISDTGIALILEFENKKERLPDGTYAAYLCPAGVPTIYAGCTEGVFMGMIVTEAEGEAMFARELAKFERAVTRLCVREPNQNQFDALVSLSYNIGEAGLAGSSVLRRFNAGSIDEAAKAFAAWNKARKNGKGPLVEMRGLTRRRTAEAALFLKPVAAETMPQAVAVSTSVTPAQIGTGAALTTGTMFVADPVAFTTTALTLKTNATGLLAGVEMKFALPALVLALCLAVAWWVGRKATP